MIVFFFVFFFFFWGGGGGGGGLGGYEDLGSFLKVNVQNGDIFGLLKFQIFFRGA